MRRSCHGVRPDCHGVRPDCHGVRPNCHGVRPNCHGTFLGMPIKSMSCAPTGTLIQSYPVDVQWTSTGEALRAALVGRRGAAEEEMRRKRGAPRSEVSGGPCGVRDSAETSPIILPAFPPAFPGRALVREGLPRALWPISTCRAL